MHKLITTLFAAWILLVPVESGAGNRDPDLSSPESGVRAFLGALRENDIELARAIMDPGLVPHLALRGFTVEDYLFGWGTLRFEAVRETSYKAGEALVSVVFLVGTSERPLQVRMIQTPSGWRWAERKGFYRLTGLYSIDVRELHFKPPNDYLAKDVEPVLYLVLTSKHIHPNSGYSINSVVSVNGSTINVRLINLEDHGQLWVPMAPFIARVKLGVSSGEYSLHISRGEEDDTYRLNIADDQIRLEVHAGTFTVPPQSVALRYPKDSFQFICLRAAEMCEGFHEALVKSGRFQEMHFPAVGRIPYLSAENYAALFVRFYRYAEPYDYELAGRMLSEYTEPLLKAKGEVLFSLVNWKSKAYMSWVR